MFFIFILSESPIKDLGFLMRSYVETWENRLMYERIDR